MNTQIKPFQFNGHQLRVLLDENGEPWFIAKEVAEILGYSDPFEMTKRLDSDEVQNLQIAGFGNRGANIINESGLYSSILGSKKPEAKPFRKAVTSEILPAIRKTGSYSINPNSSVTPPQDIQAKLNQLEVLQRYTLRNNKPWRKIAHYQPMGLNSYEIAKLTGLGETTVRTYTAQMQACGLLPKAQQLDLFGDM